MNKSAIRYALATTFITAMMTIGINPVSAETTANLGISNIYLWRGQNLASNSAMVSGSIDYAHDSGFYAGAWTSNSDNGSEIDLYFGISMEANGLSVDLSYWNYMYPEKITDDMSTSLTDTNDAEIILALGYSNYSFTAHLNAENDTPDDHYFSFGYERGPYSAVLGFWRVDDTTVSDEYRHLTLSYQANKNLGFSASLARSDTGATEEDPLFQILYSKRFDL